MNASNATQAAHYRLACDLLPLLPMIRNRARFGTNGHTLGQTRDAIGSLLTLVDHYAPLGRRTAMGDSLRDALISAQESVELAIDAIDFDEIRGHLHDVREELDSAARVALRIKGAY